MERPALLALQAQTGVLHPFAPCLTRDFEPTMFRQHFRCQRRSEILILFLDQRHGVVAIGVMDLIIRRLAARLVLDPGTAFGALRLEQPKHLSSVHAQQVRGVLDT